MLITLLCMVVISVSMSPLPWHVFNQGTLHLQSGKFQVWSRPADWTRGLVLFNMMFFQFCDIWAYCYPAKFRCFGMLFTEKKWPCFCEALRLEMQVKRFELFREDIACRHNAVAFVSFCRVCEGGQCWMLHCQDVRDLVELTVDRMDVYHLVPFRNYWLLNAPQSAFIPCRHLHPASLARLLSCIATWILFDFSGFLGHVDSDCAALMTSDIRWERFSWNFALCSFVKAECRLGHAHKHTQIIF